MKGDQMRYLLLQICSKMIGFGLKQSYFFFMELSSKSLASQNSVFDSQDRLEASSTCYDSSSRSLAAVYGILISFSIVNFIELLLFILKAKENISHLHILLAQVRTEKQTLKAWQTPKLQTSYFSHFSASPNPLQNPFIFPSFPSLAFQASKSTNQHLTTYIVKIDMSAQKQSGIIDQSQEIELSSSLQLLPPAQKNVSEPTQTQIEFQKNYPKNIFIPLIEYLTQMGYKEAYQKCVGCRGQFQGKNVVSLSSIYTLITQDWFVRNINKQGALAHISNKILINSKIKKKLFHILIAHMVLIGHHADLKDFKRRVSKQANLIARKPLPQDDLFSYPNAIIYLLFVFLKILMFHASKKGYMKLEEELEKLSLEDTPAADAKNKNVGSKEEYKFYVKEIVHVLNGKNLQIHSLTDILEETKQSILEKDKNIREKYQLIQGIPNWIYFLDVVVIRCFEYKRKDMKITNFLFNEWINECKTKMLSVFNVVREDKESTKSQNYWETGSIEWKHNKFNFSAESWNAEPKVAAESVAASEAEKVIIAGKSKEFMPIILSKMDIK